ncbi:MAG: peptidase domain-containing ABC transporter, partial [Paludibacteraceae bacterium]|nr:peptidase domain-containing ABC transporter [Paludibacteraceae bacterium]
CTDKQGTNVAGLVQAAERIGLTAKGVKGPVSALPQIPLPAIAHIKLQQGDAVVYHFVVIYQVRRTRLRIMDPATGRLEWRNISDFEAQWTGVLILLEPAESYQPFDERQSTAKRFWSLVRPHRGVMFQAFVGALCYTILGLSTSIYIEKITDYVLVGGNTQLLNLLSVIMLVILLFQVVMSVMQNVIMLRAGQLMDGVLILGYYQHLLRLPQTFFDTMRIGEITSRIADAAKIRTFVNSTIIGLLVNVLILILSLGVMFFYYWKLALLVLAVIPLYAVIYLVSDKWNQRTERKVMEDAAALEGQLVESLEATRTIKQFGLEDYEGVRTENRFVQMMYAVYDSAKNGIFASVSSEFISRLFTILVLWTGCYFVLDGHLTAGELMSFYALIGYFTSPVSSLIGANKSIRNATIAADRLYEIMDMEVEDVADKVELTREMMGDIVFTEVDFAYGTRKKIFEKLNLTFKRGEITAIVGESGSGKTTIASLLQHLYPLAGGRITIGEHDLRYLSNRSLRDLVSSVPQQIALFSGTILQNIAIGGQDPDLNKVIAWCKRLGLMEYINSLPDGIYAQVGENGSLLSGGQKQRLAIARAMYREPEVLLLDEATSSLDSVSEQYVQDVIREMRDQGRTIVIIAHRLSTVRNSDHIVVMKEGKVVEQGVFDELIRLGGEFSRLWSIQQGGMV